jgi:kynurenine formamidase
MTESPSTPPARPAARRWTDEELAALARRLDNSGRWGVDDELGTLNYITPQKRVAAAALVRSGTTVSLARPLVADASPAARVELDHRVVHIDEPDEQLGTPPFVGDYVGLESHQPGVTHLDAIGHIGGLDGRIYGGRPISEAVGDDGLRVTSIFAQRGGIVARAVLLDVPAARGVQWLEPDDEVSASDLDAAAQHAGVDISSGDAVVLRVGVDARAAEHGPSALSPGPGPEAAAWLHEHEVAVLASDSPEHITPLGARILGRQPGGRPDGDDHEGTRFPLPFHQLALPLMGLVLLDHVAVEELASVCRELRRHEFMLVAAPLALPKGTGSPVNPLAIF